jgi:hypothetical protein
LDKKLLTLEGNVIELPLSRGSKSERSAIMLDTGEKQYSLRWKNDNPFEQKTATSYLNQRILVKGHLVKRIFLVVEVIILD